MDLAECALWSRNPQRWRRIAELAAESLEILAGRSGLTESREAIAAWQTAAEKQQKRTLEQALERCRRLLTKTW